MTDDWLDLPVGPARSRLEQLSRRAEDLPADARDLVREILEAFSINVEELQVAAEELHQQNEELLATREDVEAERRRYRDLFEKAPDGYLVTDPAGIIADANQAAVDLLRVPKLDLQGKPLVVYVAPGDRDRFHRHLDRLVEGRGAGAGEGEWEKQIQPRRGPAFSAALSVTAIRDAQGRLTGLLWLLRDITASRRAVERERLLAETRAERQAADEANRLLRTLIETMPVGAVTADADGTVLSTNAAGRAILSSEVGGTVASPERTYRPYYPDGAPMPPEDMPLMQALKEGRVVRDVEILIRRKDGEDRVILASAAPVVDEVGKIASGITVFQDITARKKAEEERERLLGILNATPDLVAMATLDGELIYLNQAGCELLGLPAGADLSECSYPLCHPDWASRLVQQEGIPTAIRDGVWRGMTAILDGDGQEIPISEVILAHNDSNGDVALLSTIARDVSHRERILSQLREERARFQAIFETAPEAIMVADAEGRVQMANEAAHELYRRPVPYGQPFEPADSVQMLHPDGRPFQEHEYPILRSALRGERDHQVDMTIVWDDGQRQDLLISSAPLKYAEGRSLGAVTLIQDVTERNETKRALQLYADRLRILQAAAQVILSARSAEEVIEAVLPFVRELVPCRRASVVTFDREVGEVTLLGMQTEVETRLGGGMRMPLDERWPLDRLAAREISVVEDLSSLALPPPVVEDLSQQGVRSMVSVPLIAQGELLGALNLGLADPGEFALEHRGMIRQMADQVAIGLRQIHLHTEVERYAQRMEAMVARRTVALQTSEARFRSIFEDSVLGIALLGPEAQIIACNAALQGMLGYSQDELTGTRLTEYFHPSGTEPGKNPYQMLLSGEVGFYQVERRYVCPDGRECWSLLTYSLVQARDERKEGRIIAMVEDITEKKVSQEALLRAERMSIAGRLGASLAHEINNPLQSVIGCLGLAEEILDDGAEVRRFLEIAMEELERAAKIVAQLRDLGREPEARKEEDADLNALVEKTLLLTRKRCEDQGVEVTWSPAPGVPAVPVASERMQQVFLNLVLNAVEAMPEGGQLQVRTAATSQPDGVRVIFADTGVGIEPDRLPHLFEPFYTTQPAGLGLGLYISHRIVEDHRGQIGADSQVGKGTTFTVWLPVRTHPSEGEENWVELLYP